MTTKRTMKALWPLCPGMTVITSVIRFHGVIEAKTGREFRGLVSYIGLRKCGNDFDDALIVSCDLKLITPRCGAELSRTMFPAANL
ncbi:hypothetical protein PUN28_004828 [Cardiocondyla obscurior]|uniref:Uncharacterized protein n=1 Tax=Cardiocondyla obscurior TaxID=286306 RepID=A0AAW2GFG0_9HYME